ncbi:MAG TPA: sugar transferase [Micrococcaceae bacterium]|jgi:exopolysaccharide biosynthesis polyprenyl glycosylphosphotransferase
MRSVGQDLGHRGIRRFFVNLALPVAASAALGAGVPDHGPRRHSYPTLPLLVPRQHARKTGNALQWARHYRMKLRITDTLLVILSVVFSSEVVSRALNLAVLKVAIVDTGIAAAWLAALWLWKTRDPRIIGVGPGEYKKVIGASSAAFGWLAVIFLVNQARGMAVLFLVTMPVGTIALSGGRWLWRLWLTRQREFGHYLSRVIVLGSYEDVDYVVDQIDKKSGAAYQVVGVALESSPAATYVAVGKACVPVVGGLDDICEAVRNYDADAVIVAGQVARGSSYLRELGWKLEESATELVVALSLTNVAGPRIQMRPVEGLPLMHVDLPQFAGYKHLLKRTVDIVGSGLALLVLTPLFMVLGILIRLDSVGPVVFRQHRVCRDGNTFTMFKFRSMVVTAEEELESLKDSNQGQGLLFKVHNDPRITKVGAWMRRYSLDELPQFLNVFLGKMSLVGPRPPLPSEVAAYDGNVCRRLYIKPGVTGLWQVSGRSDLSWRESVRLDLYYVENWSLTGDFMIMWRTLKVMLHPAGSGAY